MTEITCLLSPNMKKPLAPYFKWLEKGPAGRDLYTPHLKHASLVLSCEDINVVLEHFPL